MSSLSDTLNSVLRLAFTLLAVISLLVSVAAGVGWIISDARPATHALKVEHHPNWRLGTHNDGNPAGVFARVPSPRKHQGFWRVVWFSNFRGSLILLRQNVDLGTTGGVGMTTPSHLLIFHDVPLMDLEGQVVSGTPGAELRLPNIVSRPRKPAKARRRRPRERLNDVRHSECRPLGDHAPALAPRLGRSAHPRPVAPRAPQAASMGPRRPMPRLRI